MLYMGTSSSKNAVHGQIFIQKILYMGILLLLLGML